MISTINTILAGAVMIVAPAHRPLVFGLLAVRALEWIRLEVVQPLSPHMKCTLLGYELDPGQRIALALMLAGPALSVWVTLRTLRWSDRRWSCIAAWLVAALAVLALPEPTLWWAWAYPTALGAAVVVEVPVWWRWRAKRVTAGITQRCAATLVAGDVAGLVLGLVFGWKAIGREKAAVCLVLAGMQLVWLLRFWRSRAR